MHSRAVRRTSLSALLATLALGVLPVLTAGPAAAGGPTSVLLSSPSLGRTASLYMTEAAYTELAEQVGAFTTDAGTEGGASEHTVGDPVTATWLIHDVQVWRVDRIYPDAPGGPWIATQEVLGGTGSIWDAPVRWSHAAEGKVLDQLLWTLGLVAGAPDRPAWEAVRDTAPAANTPAEDPADDSGGADGVLLALVALAGLGMGAAVAVGATLLLRRRSAARTDDLDDVGLDATADADGFATEVLVRR